MDDFAGIQAPPQYRRILARSQEIAFSMNSDLLTGAFLRALAAAKPASLVLELGTGCGLSTCWLLHGMDSRSSLISVDNDPRAQAVARAELGNDPRLHLVTADGGSWLDACSQHFDLIFADAWPGKYSHLQQALGRLNPGGVYLIDDMLPQPNWPDGHANHVAALLATLEGLHGHRTSKLSWSTGLVLCVRRPAT
jgi:predicted O-methyltransferase YrrM